MTPLARISATSLLAMAACLTLSGQVSAAPQTYFYQVEHPTYGNIGTYTNTIEQNGDKVEVKTQIHIAVKVLGIRLFHQDGDRTEQWQDGRLVAFQSDTNENGKMYDVNGAAQGDAFVISSPLGTITAPADVHPSNPWAASVLNTDMMMSTKTGKVVKAVVTDSGDTSITLDGQTRHLHQFDIETDKHYVVWLDTNGIVVAFQTEEQGSRINFVLTNAPPQPLAQN